MNSRFKEMCQQALEEFKGSPPGHRQAKTLHSTLEAKLFEDRAQTQIMTPETISRWLVEEALTDSEANVRVLDPAAGTGRLLIRALKGLTAAGISPSAALSRIRGVDIDERALAVARAGLIATAIELGAVNPGEPQLFCRDGLSSLPEADVVVMNPPYLNADQRRPEEHKAARKRWPFYQRQLDQSVCFIAAALEALTPGGRLAAITPRYWLEATRASRFRGWLSETADVQKICDLGDVQVWPRVNILTALVVLTRHNRATKGETRFWRAGGADGLESLLQGRVKAEDCFFRETRSLGQNIWSARSPREERVMGSLRDAGTSLETWVKVGQGSKTGLNRAFLLSAEEAAARGLPAELLRPLVRGREISPYRLKKGSRLLLQVTSAEDLVRWPSVAAYLETWREGLEARYQYKKGVCPWYGLSLPQNQGWMRLSPKILVPLYAKRNRFAIDREGKTVLTSVYMLLPSGSDKISVEVLTCLLNSAPLQQYVKMQAKLKRDGHMEYGARLLRELPLPITGKGVLREEGEEVREALSRAPASLRMPPDARVALTRACQLLERGGDEVLEGFVDRLCWALFGLKPPPG